MKTRTCKLLLVALLLLSNYSFSQYDTTWVVESVYGVNWFRTNQPMIDSLVAAKPHSYDPPHGGATEITLNLEENELAIFISGSLFELSFCKYSLKANENYFKVDIQECSRGGNQIPEFIYGYIMGNKLIASFSDIDFDIDENLESIIDSNEKAHWIEFTVK